MQSTSKQQCFCDYKTFRDLDVIVQLTAACKKLRYPKRLAEDTIAVLQFEIMTLMTYNYIRIPDKDAIIVCKNDSDDSLRFIKLSDYPEVPTQYNCYPFAYRKMILLGTRRT